MAKPHKKQRSKKYASRNKRKGIACPLCGAIGTTYHHSLPESLRTAKQLANPKSWQIRKERTMLCRKCHVVIHRVIPLEQMATMSFSEQARRVHEAQVKR